MEDTDTTLDEIDQVFGKEIRDIVSEVSDDKSLPKLERKRLQILHAPSSRLVFYNNNFCCVYLEVSER